MKLKNIVIVVKDIESSKQFYKELFGLDVILDQEGNAILTEGLVLQESKVWEETLGQKVVWKNHASELYFEETDLELFWKSFRSMSGKSRYSLGRKRQKVRDGQCVSMTLTVI